MKVLIIGSGGREHALAWKMQQSKRVDQVFVAPGNFGTAQEPKTANVNIAAEDIDGLLDLVMSKNIDLTVVGPEVPLMMGIVDRFMERGLLCFGPTERAAQLEGSKDFAKQFLVRHGIPTADFQSFSDVHSAIQYLQNCKFPIVIKADGLAAGKGVIIAEDLATAEQTVKDMIALEKFGEAGKCVVIEEFLQGVEASYICVVDGEQFLPMAGSQDHKTIFDGDKGPNTGGMGAYSPTPFVDSVVEERILDQVIRPTVRGLLHEGIHYTGFLYAGLMIDQAGNPKVLEFNCRFGDPETQPILFRMKSDLVDVTLAALAHQLDQVTARWDPRAALGVVVASKGYPSSYKTGAPIHGLKSADRGNIKVFHAGTASGEKNQAVVSGGRVLCVTALGENIRVAQTTAYQAISKISMENMYYRRDIGQKALQELTN